MRLDEEYFRWCSRPASLSVTECSTYRHRCTRLYHRHLGQSWILNYSCRHQERALALIPEYKTHPMRQMSRHRNLHQFPSIINMSTLLTLGSLKFGCTMMKILSRPDRRQQTS